MKGLDRLGTVGMAEDSPFGIKLRRSFSGESFGMESFTQLSQDKNKIRARNPRILNMRQLVRKGGKFERGEECFSPFQDVEYKVS